MEGKDAFCALKGHGFSCARYGRTQIIDETNRGFDPDQFPQAG